MRTEARWTWIAIWVTCLVVMGCDKKASDPATGSGAAPAGSAAAQGSAAAASGSASGSASGMMAGAGALAGVQATGGLGIPGATVKAASDGAKAACQSACDHRKKCGLDGGACVDECAALYDLGSLTDADVKSYAASDCNQVKAIEPQFRVATACRAACARRSECVTGANTKECIPDCAALVIATKQDPSVLGEYVKSDCEKVKQEEPTLICLHSCTHVLGCGVAGDLPGCLQFCGERMKQGTTLDQIAAVAKASCDEIKQTVTLPQPGGGGGGGSAKLCTAEGVYTVCDGAYCRDRVAVMLGAGADEKTAGFEAVSKCTTHMLQAIAIASINNRAAVKHSCRVTKC